MTILDMGSIHSNRLLHTMILLGLMAGWGIGRAQDSESVVEVDPLEKVVGNKVLQDYSLQPDAFYFSNKKGMRVMYPGMTLPEIEHYRKLKEGLIRPPRAFSFESISIDGQVSQNRAEMDIKINVHIDINKPSWVKIPLLMNGLNRIGPAKIPEVDGLVRWRMELNQDRGGYLLWVFAEKACDFEIQMRCSARVDIRQRPRVEFHLPEVPTEIAWHVSEPDSVLYVDGRGGEDVKTSESEGGTQFHVGCSGGDFSLIWEKVQAEAENHSQGLMAEGTVKLSWLDGQNLPTAEINLDVQRERGNIQPFEIELPANVRIIEPIAAELSRSASKPTRSDGQRFLVSPNSDNPSTLIALRLDVEFTDQEITAQSPLLLQGVDVIDALRQSGTIIVTGDPQRRLRWQPSPSVQSVWSRDTQTVLDRMVYKFQYSRVPFSLPLWQIRKERRLKVEPRYKLEVGKQSTELSMWIRMGSIPDQRRLQVNMAGWKIQSVTEMNQDTKLDIHTAGSADEIDFSEIDIEEGTGLRILIRAGQVINTRNPAVAIALPKIIAEGEAMMVASGQLTVHSASGLSFIPNLKESHGIIRAPSNTVERPNDVLAYHVKSISPQLVLAGFVDEERLRYSLKANIDAIVEEKLLVTTIKWSIKSNRVLEGQIPLELSEDPELASWQVFVDDRPAIIRLDSSSNPVLFSEQLNSNEHEIRFRRTQSLPPYQDDVALMHLTVPRPKVSEFTARSEVVVIQLKGSSGVALDTLENDHVVTRQKLSALPSEPLTIRVRRRQLQRRGLWMPRVVLQTHLGRSRRYERLVASVSGAGNLRIPFSMATPDLQYEAWVDKTSVSVEQGPAGELLVPLSPDKSKHQVDIRVWFSASTSMVGTKVRPAMVLPIGTGRLYWDLVLPADKHVIWSSPTLGRAMTWIYDQWRLRRVPTENEEGLLLWAGASDRTTRSNGNRYLYIGSDPGAMQAVSASKSMIWGVVGSLVLSVSAILVYFPVFRHPFTVVIGMVALAGLIVIASDAAVLLGQLGFLGLVLVAVMMGIRRILDQRPSSRIFEPFRSSHRDSSTRTLETPLVVPSDPNSNDEGVPVTASIGEGN